ncbi:TlpA disulfide reductase family protein [Thiomicrorhabdus xiamenensis]|uniref:TlpA family protein disulfide reductase n=1 Tax=Thiomicrorhabdus xiamenensis TaxID=2739063 RepID=A0A7D4NLE1_9GAMM|nr:TlpA disulfide reductase family protein [Thiomicrorhabdus xiamenensis]QKI90089.1 TlpA family protein disulfide reductase [Thiomicrorhabdus xiamenensis]
MRIVYLLMFVFCFGSSQAAEWQGRLEQIGDAEIPLFELQPKDAQAQILWLPSEYGVLSQERKIAEQLADKGFSVTMLDPYEALFLSPTPSAFEKIPTDWIRILIERLHDGQKPLWILAPNRAGILALKALEAYQRSEPLSQVGLLLINPNLYLNTPEPGKSADYWPQVSNANLPISVLQAELSPWRWHLLELQETLSLQGSDVFIQLMPELRDRFYFRPDALPREKQAADRLAEQLIDAMHWQLPYLTESRQIHKASAQAQPKATRSIELNVYQGIQNLPLKLVSLQGETVDLQRLKGKVVLLNFWASWCPPCVHEMPSMAALKKQLKNRPFEILAVNLGEDRETVQAFNRQHQLNFPVLLDPEGKAVKDWKVFAYPSSYVIDAEGVIRFALFGGTDWQAEHHLLKLEELLQAASTAELP